MASKSLCDACGHNMGLWQAAFTSECVHTFHLRCVSGRGACPECKAQWSDTPTVAPAPAPATPFSFASTPAFSASMFGQPATTSSFGFSSSPDFQTSLSGSSPQTTPSFSSSSGSPPAFGSSFSATSSPSLFGSSTSSMSGSSPQPTSGSSPFTSPSPPSFGIGTSLFGPQPAATPNPFASSPQFNSSPAFGSSSSSAMSSPSLFGSWSPSLIGSLPQPTSGSSPFTTPSSTPAFGSSSLFGMPATANPFWLATDQSWSCSVCHGAMGRGQATITSECNHTFHLRCFSGSVCPVCGARWRDQVTVSRPSSSQVNPFSNPPPLFPQVNVTPRTPSPTPPTPSPFPAPSSPFSFSFAPANNPSPTPPPSSELFSFAPANNPSSTPPPSSSLFNFNDDEPVEPPLEGWDTVPEVANNGALILTTHCEYPAVARDAAQENFAVLLHAKAPVAPAEASERAPLDLVTVLDVSYSMIGAKIALVKQAMGFVIDKLGSGDRLSVVTFSGNARRIIRLTRMSDDGKASARAAVESLRATDSTNIGAGLQVAAQVLDDRRHKNAVSSVILLSDGQDNHTLGRSFDRGDPKTYIDLVPTSLRRGGGDGSALCTPVHTFGFGTDHDAAAMHAIAEATGGTFSFIENEAVVQDSFAQCIGGLLSVAVLEARIKVECLDPSVRVRAVKSGRYKSNVDADGRAASVDVGELYAEEERRFLLLLDVPVAAAGDGHAQQQDGDVTRLIKASCTYKDAATGRSVDVAAGEDAAAVRRPVAVAAADAEPSMEVARERFRVEAAEDIASARAAAEQGQHAEAARILDRRREASVAAGLSGDARCAALAEELRELSARVADRREYEHTGRAFMLAGISSHAQQRAATVQLTGSAAPGGPRFGAAAALGNSSAGSMPAFGTMAPFGATAAGSGRSSSSPFGDQPLGFVGASTPTFGSAAPAFGATSSPGLFGAAASPQNSLIFSQPGAAAPCFTFGYATPAMQSMVDSSRKTREQQQSEPAAETKGDTGTFWR